jgi:transcriptional regulator with XRE-family HTH domain
VFSERKLKAVVLGSYERGTRNLTIKRAIDIAEIYNIPLNQLLSEQVDLTTTSTPRLMLDIRKLQQRVPETTNINTRHRALLLQFLKEIVEERQDWNGEVITLRESDFGVLQILLAKKKNELIDWLQQGSVLLQKRSC